MTQEAIGPEAYPRREARPRLGFRYPLRRIAAICGVSGIALLAWVSCAMAQGTAPGSATGQTPSLVTLVTTETADGVYHYNALEFAAARANDAAYASLLPLCAGATAATSCTGAT